MAVTLTTLKGLNVALCLHTPAPVPQPEWTAALKLFQRLGSAEGGDSRLSRFLVVTDGGGPDAKQRSQLKDTCGGRTIKTAVIVPGMGNPVKRGMMTALTWINPQMGFYMPVQLREALLHLDLLSEQVAIWPQFVTLQKLLPPVRTLKLIAEHAALPWSFETEPQRAKSKNNLTPPSSETDVRSRSKPPQL